MPDRDYVPGHGDRSFAVLRYVLDLDYKVPTNHLSGDAVLTVQATEPVRELTLDLYGLHVGKVTVDGKPPARHARRGAKLVVRLREELPAGAEATLTIAYAGKPAPVPGQHGRAGWEELTDGVLVGSQPHGAPSWFPCNDRPDDKASYRLAVTVAAEYHVVGNGTLVSRRVKGGRVTYVYAQDEPMSTYLASVQIGQYTVTRCAAPAGATPLTVPVEIVHPGRTPVGARTAFARQGEMVAVFSDLFGPYPFAAYRAVVTADELEIPLEAQSLSSFGVNHTRPGWENERLVAHELAHQWFGNSLTVRHWRDIWLHEGFACYAEWLWSERSGGKSAAEHAKHHYARLAKLPQDLVLGDPGARSMFDDRVYKRGALTLQVVRNLLGDKEFFDLLREWTAEHAYGTVTTEQFRQLLTRRAPAAAPKLLDAWLTKAKLPPLTS